jgi:hypothetical protein
MAKQTLKDKELTKLKKVIKKLKEAKKRKRKQRRNDGVTQKVSQKVIIGSNVKENKATENVGRSFPQIQFLPQTQSQSFDTQLLRDLLLQKNSSPLTRPVKESVSVKPSYDLADQYGLNLETPVRLGNPIYLNYEDNQSDISSLTNFDSYIPSDKIIYEPDSVLQPPPEKQGKLDEAIKDPEPINLGKKQSKITSFYLPKPTQEEVTKTTEGDVTGDVTKITDLTSKEAISKSTEDIFNEPDDISKASTKFTTTIVKPKKAKPELIIINPNDYEEVRTSTTEKKKRGPRGKYTKTLEREKMKIEDIMGEEY